MVTTIQFQVCFKFWQILSKKSLRKMPPFSLGHLCLTTQLFDYKTIHILWNYHKLFFCFQVSPQLMSCLIWKPRKQAYILYLEHIPVMSHTDFSPLNERYNLIFWQISIGNELQKLSFGSKHNMEPKKYTLKTLVLGLCLDLCKCPTLKNTHSKKTVQIWFFGNNSWSMQRILKVNDSMDSVSK